MIICLANPVFIMYLVLRTLYSLVKYPAYYDMWLNIISFEIFAKIIAAASSAIIALHHRRHLVLSTNRQRIIFFTKMHSSEHWSLFSTNALPWRLHSEKFNMYILDLTQSFFWVEKQKAATILIARKSLLILKTTVHIKIHKTQKLGIPE